MIVACLFSSFLLLRTRCEVFNGISVDVFHEGLNAGLWDFEVG